MQSINEKPCPECGKLIQLFEKPDDPRRLVGACNCVGRLRSVIEIDNPNFMSERDILEPLEPQTDTEESISVQKPSLRRKYK